MKSAAFVGVLCMLLALTAKAQLTLLPQIGIDRSKTTIHYNDISSFSPLDGQASFKANLRLDYRFRKGHGPYLGIGTSPGVVDFSFADPSSAVNNYKATTGSLQWKFEAGYQYTSKSIPFGKQQASAPKEQNRCGGSHYGCGSKQRVASNRTNLKLQPSVGIAYSPSVDNKMSTLANGYSYSTGNWKTAFVSGLAFEFGKGKERIMTWSFQYAKGLGSDHTETIEQMQAGKPVINSFSSSTSIWSMSVGIPFSLSKTNKHTITKSTNYNSKQKQDCRTRCQSYHTRCMRQI
ncbi:MAG: hypothetical protein ACJ749_04210 [Flavisolibacter sp.]